MPCHEVHSAITGVIFYSLFSSNSGRKINTFASAGVQGLVLLECDDESLTEEQYLNLRPGYVSCGVNADEWHQAAHSSPPVMSGASQ